MLIKFTENLLARLSLKLMVGIVIPWLYLSFLSWPTAPHPDTFLSFEEICVNEGFIVESHWITS